MTKELLISFFYLILTIITYMFFNKLYMKLKYPILNPVLVSSCFIILLLLLFKITFQTYNKGGKIITGLLGPLVVVLAIPLYKNKQSLIKNFIPIMGGVLSGIITTFITVLFLCKLFNVEYSIMLSLFAKSITTPMAVEATKILGGKESITIISVVITGIVGGGFAPLVVKYGKVKNDVAKGIGIGTSSHAIGTSKAIEMGEEIGAASGLAMAVTGITTILLIIAISNFF